MVGFEEMARWTVVAAALVTQTMGMEVIGLGQGRTGTESLKTALIELGFGPTYHMKEVLFEEQGVTTAGHIALWEAAAKGQHVDWPTTLKGFKSGVDQPPCCYPDEMYAAFPKAKYILTLRPAEKWWDSIQNSICWFHSEQNWPFKILLRLPVFPFSRIKEQLPMLDAMVKYKIFEGNSLSTWQQFCDPANKALTIASYDAHTAKVKKLIPEEQLLVFEPGKSTYKELAAFLGVNPPDKEYPHVNSRSEFTGLINGLSAAAVAVVVLPILLVLLIAYCCRPKGAQKRKGE